MAANDQAQYDFIIVGSGAGGGTLAARLAEYEFKVLLLEAGGDPRTLQGGDPPYPDQNRLPDDYDVPVFHAFASENDAMKWDFFVKHYRDETLAKRDPKYRGAPDNGILYPRAGTLGGCTAHNAQITVYPHNDDWRFIEELTGDSSWGPKNMRKYFMRMEDCHHRGGWRFLYNLTRINPTRHGFRGWFRTEVSIPEAALDDEDLVKVLIKTIATAAEDLGSPLIERLKWLILGKGDPNDWRLVQGDSTGIRYPPLATNNHARHGARERVLDVQKKHPDRLTIEMNALATRVLFDESGKTAIGVEYLKGARLYRAGVKPSSDPGELRQVYAKREVILAGGAYNTPQLLLLSGIGPASHLNEMGIPVRADLRGVGSNLQDRYEVGVVNRMNFPAWWVLKNAKFAAGDPQYQEWSTKREGVYTTNGAVAAIIKRSVPQRPLPDLFIFALLGLFRGYFPGYSKLFKESLNYLTWAILKAHTQNCAGSVRLKSKDPRDTPDIDFCYFTEGNDTGGDDLTSVVEGVKFVRKLTAPLIDRKLIAAEELPGPDVRTDEQIADFVKDQAWGHHASCSCPMGSDEASVVNKDFQVHGVKNLRIVDASVFPKIPGFFIVTSIYMIGEKAADVIANANGKKVSV